MVQARRFICFVFLRVLENVSMVRGICIDIDLIEAKQSDETNKREGMQASSLISSLLLLLHHFVAISSRRGEKLVSLVSPLEHVKSFHFDPERYRIPVDIR